MAGFANERIRIRMEGYDHEVLDRTAVEIVQTATETGARGAWPDPAAYAESNGTPCCAARTSTARAESSSEIRTHKRLIDILRPTGKTIEALNKGLSLPPGVDIKIRVMASGGLTRSSSSFPPNREYIVPSGLVQGDGSFLRNDFPASPPIS